MRTRAHTQTRARTHRQTHMHARARRVSRLHARGPGHTRPTQDTSTHAHARARTHRHTDTHAHTHARPQTHTPTQGGEERARDTDACERLRVRHDLLRSDPYDRWPPSPPANWLARVGKTPPRSAPACEYRYAGSGCVRERRRRARGRDSAQERGTVGCCAGLSQALQVDAAGQQPARGALLPEI